jgi:hypothetical protein
MLFSLTGKAALIVMMGGPAAGATLVDIKALPLRLSAFVYLLSSVVCWILFGVTESKVHSIELRTH